MAKYNIYAIAYGVDPITNTPQPTVLNLKFKTWEECKPYILGVKGAKYKGFLTEDEADAWLEKTRASLKNDEDEVKECVYIGSSYQSSNSQDYNESFKNICANLGVHPKDMSLYLQQKFVEEQKFIASEALGLPWR